MSEVLRVRMSCAYRGTFFKGWAKQPGLRTVQGVLEAALALIFQRELELTVAGRTDAGVHASAQTAHFDVSAGELAEVMRLPVDVVSAAGFALDLSGLTKRLNRLVSRAEGGSPQPDLVVAKLEVVSADFDARFAALRRHYVYRIGDLEGRNPLYAETVWWVEAPLQLGVMREAAVVLLGEHDFLSFCKPRLGASTVRTLERVELFKTEVGLEVHLTADAFCHSMVRSIVGALVEVGRGRRDPEWLARLLAAPSRQGSAPLAPAHGLTLAGVDYPPAHLWAAQQGRARRLRSLGEVVPEGGGVSLAGEVDCCGE